MYATAEREADIRTAPVRRGGHHQSHSHHYVHNVPSSSARSRPTTAEERGTRYESPSPSSALHPPRESIHAARTESLTTSSSRPFSALEHRNKHNHSHTQSATRHDRRAHERSENPTSSASMRVNRGALMRMPGNGNDDEAHDAYAPKVKYATDTQLRQLTHHHHHHHRHRNTNSTSNMDGSNNSSSSTSDNLVSRSRNAGRREDEARATVHESRRRPSPAARAIQPQRAGAAARGSREGPAVQPQPLLLSSSRSHDKRSGQHTPRRNGHSVMNSSREAYGAAQPMDDRRREEEEEDGDDDDDEASATDLAGLTSYRTPPRSRSAGQRAGHKLVARNGQSRASAAVGRRTPHIPSPLRLSRDGDDRHAAYADYEGDVIGGANTSAGGYAANEGRTSQPRPRCEGSFRVRLHRASNLFAATLDIAAVPALFVSLHTRDERGHSSTVSGQLSPVFNDEFVFASHDVERDALACTVVALTHQGAAKRVAECVVSLKYLLRHVSRQVWVPLVRHAGTAEAYVRGELLLSLYSADYGLHTMPSEEDEIAFRNELQHLLVKYAPAQLHRLDWLVGEYLTRDEAARTRLRNYLQQQQQQQQQPKAQTDERPAVRAAAVRTTIESTPERFIGEAAPPPSLHVPSASSASPSRPRVQIQEAEEATPTKPQDAATLSFTVTLGEVTELTEAYGRPANVSTCYVVLSNAQGGFRAQSKAVPYVRRALLDESFTCAVRDPRTEALSLTLFSATRKIGEAMLAFGGGELSKGKPRQVQLMLVRAAATGDAATAGFLSLTLRLQRSKTSTTSAEALRRRMLPSRSVEDEARLRQRVLGYLWRYLRDDLHRLDVLVTGITDIEAQMRDWSKTIGPEPIPRHVTLELLEAHGIGLTNNNTSSSSTSGAAGLGSAMANNASSAAAADGSAATMAAAGGAASFVGFASVPCYVRVLSGPYLLRSPSAMYRDGAVVFQAPLSVTLFDPAQDALELLLIAETASGDREVGRVVIGVANLSRGQAERRALHLVANALTAEAHVQGELSVELAAEDFGASETNNEAARQAQTSQSSQQQQPSEYYSHLLESLMERNAPEQLHRVPYILSCTRDQTQLRQLVEAKSREFGNEVAAAPMTVRVLGLREFRPCCDCYVKVYLNNAPLLRTKDKAGGSATVTFDIADDNEQTVMLSDARHAVLTLKVGQHKALRKSRCISVTELVLSSMIRGEVNTLWIPIFADGPHSHRESVRESGGAGERATTTMKDKTAIQRNVLPAAVQARVGAYSGGMNGASSASASSAPLGLLGVELQSLAFTQTTVTMYKDTAQSGELLSAHEAVTRDVTTLLTKYNPRELSKVQPLIASQASLRDAHSELRARFCPRAADATVYLHVDAIEMVSVEGRQLEEQGAIALEASFYDERQQARKTADFANDAIHRRVYYPVMRLDLANPQPRTQDGTAGETSQENDHVTAAAGALAVGDESRVLPPLVLKLLRVAGNAAIDTRNDRLGRPSMSPSRGRHGRSLSRGRGASKGGATPARTRHASLSVRHHGNRMDSFLEPGAATEASNYAGTSSSMANGSAALDSRRASYATTPLTTRMNNHHHNNNNTTMMTSAMTNGGSASNATTVSFVRNGLSGVQSEVGTVVLSLRGLLCSALYQPGSAIRVPLVACSATGENVDVPRTSAAATATLLAQVGPMNTNNNNNTNTNTAASSVASSYSLPASFGRVVGTVTLRLTAPAFEKYPEWLKLTRRVLLAELEPDFVHYYERRLGSCLRAHCTAVAAELARMHYYLYELHVARGVWPLSLPRWLARLHEQLGVETDYYGIPPTLAPTLRQAAELRLRGLEGAYKEHQKQQQRAKGQDVVTHTSSIHSTVLQNNSPQRSTRRELSPEYSLGDLPEVLSVDGTSRAGPSVSAAATANTAAKALQPQKATNQSVPDVRLSIATSASRRSGAEAGKAAASYGF